MKKFLHAKEDRKECKVSHQTCYKVTTKAYNYSLLPTRCHACSGCKAVQS